MARPSDIKSDELRGHLERAFAALRAGRGAEAVHACADGYLRFVALNPAVMGETIAMRGRQISRLLRWPALGANLKPDSVAARAPEIEFLRDRFSVSEAMTYYQYVLDEIVEHERREA